MILGKISLVTTPFLEAFTVAEVKKQPFLPNSSLESNFYLFAEKVLVKISGPTQFRAGT
jgi:hypothetical protein